VWRATDNSAQAHFAKVIQPTQRRVRAALLASFARLDAVAIPTPCQQECATRCGAFLLALGWEEGGAGHA
jgi:hypothetical protein